MTATESFSYGDKNFSVKTKKWPEIKRFQATRKPDDIIPTRQMEVHPKQSRLDDVISFGFI